MLSITLLCACPPADAIETTPTATCLENFGQTQKLIFQRTKDGTVINEITIGTSDPATLATWTALKSATDSSKVSVTPFIQNPSNEAGEAREFGGGNETLNGIPIILGSSPSPFEAMFYGMKQDVIASLKKLMCDAQADSGISVFLVNENGQIAGSADSLASPTKVKGFPIQSLFVSDKVLGGYDAPDSNMIKWSFRPNWSDTFYVITPSDFDALSQL